jgi:hypothetical protein
MDKYTQRDDWTEEDRQRLREALDQARRDLQATQQALAQTLETVRRDSTSSTATTEPPQSRQQELSQQATF